MDTRMINFVIPNKLLKDVDRLAEKESRSRSELLREAARRYIQEKEERSYDLAQIRKSAKSVDMNEQEAFYLIEEIRDSLPMNQ